MHSLQKTQRCLPRSSSRKKTSARSLRRCWRRLYKRRREFRSRRSRGTCRNACPAENPAVPTTLQLPEENFCTVALLLLALSANAT